MSGSSALIQISKNKSLIFTVNGENLEIEKSLFLGEKNNRWYMYNNQW